MQPRTSIYHKLILYIFFLGIFVIVTVSLYSFFTASNAILQRTFDQLISLRLAKKEQVEKFFTDRIKEAELYSNQEDNNDTRALNGQSGASIFRDAHMSTTFREFFKSGGYFSDIYIADKQDIECYNFDSVACTTHKPDSSEIQALKLLISRTQNGTNRKNRNFAIQLSESSARIFVSTCLPGSCTLMPRVALFEINPAAIEGIMKNKGIINGLGKSGEVYLVGPDSLMRSESRFFLKSRSHLPIRTESVRNAFNGLEGSHLNIDYRGVLTLSSYSRLNIPDLNWVIIADIDKKEAMRPVYKLANEIVFLSIFITLILFVASYIISRSITGPIIALKDATIRVRKGDLVPILNIKSNDELGELTRNFNLMTSQLKAQQTELKEREMKVLSSFIDGQEDERQRLSRELHDGLGQMIIATKLKTETIMNTANEINSLSMKRLREMFDSLVDEVRGISNNLMPAALKEFGLEFALKQVCSEMEDHSNIKVIFDSQMAEADIDKRIATYIFRIAQEALTNAVKHSGATEIIVTLIGSEKLINLQVQDDGTGINATQPGSQNGRGLNNMTERVKLLNGLINISIGEKKGTIVSVKIPLDLPWGVS